MIILILPFTGDVSQIISEEVAQVFSVMKGSDATQVSTTNTYIRTQNIILFLKTSPLYYNAHHCFLGHFVYQQMWTVSRED